MTQIDRLNLIRLIASRPRQKNPIAEFGLLPVTEREIEQIFKEEFLQNKMEILIEDEENIDDDVDMSPLMRKVYK